MLNNKKVKDLARIARVAEVSDHSNLKILTRQQMLQRLTIALAQVKTDNASENLQNEFQQIIYLCIEQEKLLEKYIII